MDKSKRFGIEKGHVEHIVDYWHKTIPQMFVNNQEIVDMLNDLNDELEARKRIESKLRKRIAVLTNGNRYTYFRGHEGWGVQDTVDPYNDESSYPSLICVVQNEAEAKSVCDYLNMYEKESWG